ncbi:hypothetical protein GXW83_16595 [Streptacidiphilus sp. PB12-B1b]|uniref:hypothetical protein n=1 Tax=Streptacidiphilus sp. PB12-B1b TaxID=2705012 RepID=UPI0015F8AB19|nr:hypothetical protein [Streptacidiphilus sp. PB12-B1b]QMU77087.1 hypothetical protein GXW83_16595 [Streptacidiphilus sp. PB12-B1b]
MSEKYVWRMVVTDSRGRKDPSTSDMLPNPYISDEPAQHVAERVLGLIAPGYAAQEPAPKSIEIQVWSGHLRGDPIATAEWHHGAA